MLKLRLFFTAFSVLLLIQVLSPIQGKGKSVGLTKETETQSKFEESTYQCMCLGDVSAGEASISVFSTVVQNSFPNLKLKSFETTIQLDSSKANQQISRSSEISSLAYRIDEIPIYLQVRNFII